MTKHITVDTHIDTVGFRCVSNSKEERDCLFNQIVGFISKRKMVGIEYDKKRSTKYYQITKFQSGNTTLGTIAKSYYENTTSSFNSDYWYINLNFYGLKRYHKIKDDASMLLVKTIAAYLNTYDIHFGLIETDIAMDIHSKIENILAVCIRRSANVDYLPLGDLDDDGNLIQEDEGTYNIEKFESFKSKKNAMSRAYLYNKRKKELEKFKFDIGFELTRFEVKLQKRYFVKNQYCTGVIYKTLDKYAVLAFEDIKQKEILIQKCNSAKSSKKRREVIEDAIERNIAKRLSYRMDRVGDFLREIDTVKFDAKGNFIYTKREDYLYSYSKFNRKH